MSNYARKFYNEQLYRSCRRLGCIAMAAVLQGREKEGKGGEKEGKKEDFIGKMKFFEEKVKKVAEKFGGMK